MAMITVDGVEMPCPSTYTWGLSDVSAAESARTEDTTMHKNRKGQKRTISLGWNAIGWQKTSQNISQYADQNPHDRRAEHGKGKNTARFVFLSFAKAGRNQHSRACRHCHRQRDQNLNQGYRNCGGGHSVAAKPIADEYPVYDHIDRIKKQPYHLRQSVLCKQGV